MEKKEYNVALCVQQRARGRGFDIVVEGEDRVKLLKRIPEDTNKLDVKIMVEE